MSGYGGKGKRGKLESPFVNKYKSFETFRSKLCPVIWNGMYRRKMERENAGHALPSLFRGIRFSWFYCSYVCVFKCACMRKFAWVRACVRAYVCVCLCVRVCIRSLPIFRVMDNLTVVRTLLCSCMRFHLFSLFFFLFIHLFPFSLSLSFIFLFCPRLFFILFLFSLSFFLTAQHINFFHECQTKMQYASHCFSIVFI